MRHRVAMVRWLALEASVSAASMQHYQVFCIAISWLHRTQADSWDLLEVVRLLVGAGFSDWEGTSDDATLGVAAASRGDLALMQYRYLLQQSALFRASFNTLKSAVVGGCEALIYRPDRVRSWCRCSAAARGQGPSTPYTLQPPCGQIWDR